MSVLTGKTILVIGTILLIMPFFPTSASEAVDALLSDYQSRGVKEFSAAAGESLWKTESSGRSCTSCHSTSVKSVGKHERTGKPILAMAPSVNPKRLTNKKKIEKWFLRNCKWTFDRQCTVQEKADILLWLSSQ